MDAVLPAATQQWCDGQLQSMGFDPHTSIMLSPDERVAPYKNIYIELRYRIMMHVDFGHEPQLGELESPIGTWNYQGPQPNAGYDFAQDGLVADGVREYAGHVGSGEASM